MHLPRSADVVIIGAGVIGASIAYYLTRHGIRPCVIDRGDPASGSSGACDGLVFLQSKKPGIHLKLALESRKRFENLSDILGKDIAFRKTGGMCIIETEAEFEAMRLFVEEQRRSGLAVELIDGGQARRLEPCLADRVVAATVSELDAQINPYALTFALLREARAQGARVFSGQTVTDLLRDGDTVKGVQTQEGRIEVPIVVNAAGAHAADIGRMIGIDLPIIPRRGQILVTQTMPPMVHRCMISAGYIAVKFKPELAASGEMGFSLEQTETGNFLIGSTREFVGFDRRTTFDGIRSMAQRIVSVIPALSRVRVIRSFAGFRPYTPDGLPILGQVAGWQGFVVAAGHEGDGIALSAVTGEGVADWIATGETSLPLNAFRLERFSTVGK